MLILFGETHNLVFNGRAITRAAALDLAAIHRCAMQVRANNFVRRLDRPGHVTRDLRHGDFAVQE